MIKHHYILNNHCFIVDSYLATDMFHVSTNIYFLTNVFCKHYCKNQITKTLCSESVTKNTHLCYGTYCDRCIVDKAIDTLLYVVFCVPLFLARSLEYSFQSVVREIVLFHTTHISSPSTYLLHRVLNLGFIASHHLYSFTFHPTLDTTIE